MEGATGAMGLSLSMEDRGSKKRAMETRRLKLGTSSIGYNMMMVERSRSGTAMGEVDGSAQVETRGAAAAGGAIPSGGTGRRDTFRPERIPLGS